MHKRLFHVDSFLGAALLKFIQHIANGCEKVWHFVD